MRSNNLKILLQLDAKGNMSKGIKDATGELRKFENSTKTASTGADRLADAIRRVGHYGGGAALPEPWKQMAKNRDCQYGRRHGTI